MTQKSPHFLHSHLTLKTKRCTTINVFSPSLGYSVRMRLDFFFFLSSYLSDARVSCERLAALIALQGGSNKQIEKSRVLLKGSRLTKHLCSILVSRRVVSNIYMYFHVPNIYGEDKDIICRRMHFFLSSFSLRNCFRIHSFCLSVRIYVIINSDSLEEEDEDRNPVQDE